MIRSLQQLDFIHSGGSLRLLSAGDDVEPQPAPAFGQQATEWQESGWPWGAALAPGGATATVSFAVRREHGSHAAARDFCLLSAALFPAGLTGTLRAQTQCGHVFDMPDAVLTASAAAPAPDGRSTRQSYALTGAVPVQVMAVGEATGETRCLLTPDAEGEWFEFGFVSPSALSGDAARGWVDQSARVRVWMESSTDLQNWTTGGWADCAGFPAAVAEGWEYRARFVVPRLWFSVLIDRTVSSNRYGKSIDGIFIDGVPVDLPGYPYAMPAAAATLQADLRAEGYTGALVTTTTGALVARAMNHTPARVYSIALTMSGASVTGAAVAGVPVTLPGAPYAMPSQKGALQTALRAAGLDGAVVTLYQDTWSILLPDLLAGGYDRAFHLTVTPGDPFPAWDRFGVYLGEVPATMVNGGFVNVRTPAGTALLENPRHFARLGLAPL